MEEGFTFNGTLAYSSEALSIIGLRDIAELPFTYSTVYPLTSK